MASPLLTNCFFETYVRFVDLATIFIKPFLFQFVFNFAQFTASVLTVISGMISGMMAVFFPQLTTGVLLAKIKDPA